MTFNCFAAQNTEDVLSIEIHFEVGSYICVDTRYCTCKVHLSLFPYEWIWHDFQVKCILFGVPTLSTDKSGSSHERRVCVQFPTNLVGETKTCVFYTQLCLVTDETILHIVATLSQFGRYSSRVNVPFCAGERPTRRCGLNFNPFRLRPRPRCIPY
jgi:hypothetical protein